MFFNELALDGCIVCVCADLADEVDEGETVGGGRPVAEGSTPKSLQYQVGHLVLCT